MAANEALPVSTEAKAEVTFFDDIADFFSDIIAFITDLFDFQKELPDVSEWTDEEIIEYYKKAARKTKYKKADREFVDNGYTFEVIEPKDYDDDSLYNEIFMESYLSELNSKQIKGVMGNYKKLTADDCKSIKAYTEGEYTVIELKFKNQHDSIKDKEDVITMSHGMLDFGELSPAISRINTMGMKMKINDATADYSDAVAKVKINSSGKVEYGTWVYNVYGIMNITGESIFIQEMSMECDVTMDFSCTMTLGGGF